MPQDIKWTKAPSDPLRGPEAPCSILLSQAGLSHGGEGETRGLGGWFCLCTVFWLHKVTVGQVIYLKQAGHVAGYWGGLEAAAGLRALGMCWQRVQTAPTLALFPPLH